MLTLQRSEKTRVEHVEKAYKRQGIKTCMLIKEWTTYDTKHKDIKGNLCLLGRSEPTPWI